jgi:arginine decarboxylase
MVRRDHQKMPLVEALLHYVNEGVIPFHTPGHKQGKGIHNGFFKFVGRNALAVDLALIPELDDLHEPHGAIKEAQEMAADLYGADHSFFVINGTTGGIYAMILTICGPGDKIIVPRNAHRSIIGGIILCGGIPIFVEPAVDNELALTMGITYEAVVQSLQQHPDAKGVLLINPTYYGVATYLKDIVDLVHEYGIPVIVDEAHGPHLHFSEDLPISALAAGADICAQSTHKILGAMTQCSMVHAREGRINVRRLKAMLQLVQTTSPNYLLMASLDATRSQMALEGRELIARTIAIAQDIRTRINQIPGLYCFGEEKIGQPGVHSMDPTKVTVTVKGIGLSGSEVEYLLRHKYKIQVELSDLYNVLFIISLGDGQAEADALVHAFADLTNKYAKPKEMIDIPIIKGLPHPPEQIMSPRQALFAETKTVPFKEATGMVCAEIVTFYPPGIPMLCPGEQITPDIIEYCEILQAAGLHISGPEDPALQTIKVVEIGPL